MAVASLIELQYQMSWEALLALDEEPAPDPHLLNLEGILVPRLSADGQAIK